MKRIFLSLFILLLTCLPLSAQEVYENVGDQKATVEIDRVKESVRASFNCGTPNEMYWFEVTKQTSGDLITDNIFRWDDKRPDFLKWDIVLDKKPNTNVFVWEITASKGLKFSYQMPLEEEAQMYEAQGGHDSKAIQMIRDSIREPDIDGSYAVYIDGKKGRYLKNGKVKVDYKTGKLCHIPRPLCIEADGKEWFAKVEINKIAYNGINDFYKLRITVPQDKLDNAKYPLTIDPTLGYTSIGATTYSALALIGSQCEGTTAGSAGVATKIYFYCHQAGSVKVTMYDGDGDGTGDDRLIPTYEVVASAQGWEYADVSGQGFAIEESTDYYLWYCNASSSPTMTYVRRDGGDADEFRYAYSNNTVYADQFADPSDKDLTATFAWNISLYLEFDDLDAITLTDITANRVYQRDSDDYVDITVSGTYAGANIYDVQAQIVDASDHTTAITGCSWTMLDSTPTEDAFSGVFEDVPVGGPYEVQVRSRNAGETVLDTSNGSNDFFVGKIYLCMGQSNMDEMFDHSHHTGDEDYSTNSRVLVFEDGGSPTWRVATHNGAICFGDTLEDTLDVPIGMIDMGFDAQLVSCFYGAGVCVDDVEDAIAEVAGSNTYAYEGILWKQGYTDALGGVSAAIYQSRLESVLTLWRGKTEALLGVNTPVFIHGLVTDPGDLAACSEQDWEDVKNGLKQTYNDGNTDVDIFFCDGNYTEATGHMSGGELGYTKVGRHLAQAVLYYEGEVGWYQGPKIGYEIKDADEIYVHCLFPSGSDADDIAPTSPTEIVGFTTTGAGDVTSATRTDADTITLTVDGSTASLTALYLGFGKMLTADVGNPPTNYPHDDSALVLPDAATINLALWTPLDEIPEWDAVDPTCTITTPTSDATYDAGWTVSGNTLSNTGDTNDLTIAGSASDDNAVTEVKWSCATCTPTSGTATGTTSWTFTPEIAEGSNTIVVTAYDAFLNSNADTITVTYDSTYGVAVTGDADGDVIRLHYNISSPDSGSGELFANDAIIITQLVNKEGTHIADFEVSDSTKKIEFTTDSTNGWEGSIDTTGTFVEITQDN